MSKISNDKILEVFLEISKGTASKRKLESITGVSRKRIAAFMSMLSSKGYKPNDVLNFTEEELNLVFERNCHRKEFIEPDFKTCYEFLNPKGVYKKEQLPTLAEAWIEKYVKVHFSVPEDMLNVNSLKFNFLPDGCMSLSTFKTKYAQYSESIKAKYSGLSTTASIGESKPGFITEIDGVGDLLIWQDKDGNNQKARVFVSVLKFSGLIFIYACPRATTEDWARFIINSFKYFGGVTASIKADNDVALTTRRKIRTYAGKDKLDIEPNPTMCYLAKVYDCDFILAKPFMAREKGSVERAVKTVEGLIAKNDDLRNKKFNSLAEINELLESLANEFNSRPTSSGCSHRSYFEAFEKDCLKRLPSQEIILDNIRKAIVSARGYVRFLGNDYALSPEYIGQTVYCVENPRNKLQILNFFTMEVIETYSIDRKPHPNIMRYKNKHLMTLAERYALREYDDYKQLINQQCPLLSNELDKLFAYINGSTFVLNQVDKTELCNRVLKLCSEHVECYKELKEAIDLILSTNAKTSLQILKVLKDAISKDSKHKQFTKRKEVVRQVVLAGFNSAQSSNARNKDDFDQKWDEIEELEV